MDYTIKRLRDFFTVSNAVLELVESIYESSKELNTDLAKLQPQRKLLKEVHELHKAVLNELQKESPNLSAVNAIMKEMELIAERNTMEKQKAIKMKFKPGGFFFNPEKENEQWNDHTTTESNAS